MGATDRAQSLGPQKLFERPESHVGNRRTRSGLRTNRFGVGIRRQRYARLSGDESDRAGADPHRRRFHFVGIEFDRPVSRQPVRAGDAGAARSKNPSSRQSMDGLADVDILARILGCFSRAGPHPRPKNAITPPSPKPKPRLSRWQKSSMPNWRMMPMSGGCLLYGRYPDGHPHVPLPATRSRSAGHCHTWNDGMRRSRNARHIMSTSAAFP